MPYWKNEVNAYIRHPLGTVNFDHVTFYLGLGFRVNVRVRVRMNIFSDYSVAKYAPRSVQVYRPESC